MVGNGVGVVDPKTAYDALGSDNSSILIDVRTHAEWSFVGAPDLSGLGKQVALIEWQSFPTMAVNEAFAQQALSAIGDAGATTAYFICRSGARSMNAAIATAAASGGAVACHNVAEGFEGDLSAEGRRGEVNGWKARGLPWRQS